MAKTIQTRDRNADVNNLQAAPHDEELKLALRAKLATLSTPQLHARLARQMKENRVQDTGSLARLGSDGLGMLTRILDTGGTSTGNVLPRVDLEQTIYALFVRMFPVWDRINKAPANGLKHSWNAATATGAAADTGLTAASDLANALSDVGTYNQYQTVNMAIIDTLRGVSLKELFAVQQSGMSYDPAVQEIMLGTVRIKSLLQRLILQGNQSVAAKAGTTEWGTSNANAFDGLRLITGGLGTYTPAVTQVDQDGTVGGGPFTISQAINYAAAQTLNQGANPSILWGSPIALNKVMNEQEGKQRTDAVSLTPGLSVPGVNTVNGILPYIMAPGSGSGANSALGQYARQSDGTNVEDLYVLDESMLTFRYLGGADIQVIEIPIGVDTQLSKRYILFMIGGLQVADAGLFQGKIRIPV